MCVSFQDRKTRHFKFTTKKNNVSSVTTNFHKCLSTSSSINDFSYYQGACIVILSIFFYEKGDFKKTTVHPPQMWSHALVLGSRFERTWIYTKLGIPQMTENLLNFQFYEGVVFYITKKISLFFNMHSAKSCWKKMYEVWNVNGPLWQTHLLQVS